MWRQIKAKVVLPYNVQENLYKFCIDFDINARDYHCYGQVEATASMLLYSGQSVFFIAVIIIIIIIIVIIIIVIVIITTG